MRNFIFVAAGICLLILGLAACQRDLTMRELVKTKALFAKKCQSCHGPTVDDFVKTAWKNGNSRLELINSIKNGPKGVPNHAFAQTISDKAALNLANYLLQSMTEQKDKRMIDAAPKNGIFMSEGMKVRLDTIIKDVENPWGMAFTPTNDLLFTERSGKLWRLDPLKRKTEIKGVPETLVESQGGLLDVRLHPEFEKNQLIYLSYSKFVDSLDAKWSTTAIYRARLKNDSLEEGRDIFVAKPFTKTRYHYGSRIEFDKNNMIFLSVGDRGMQDSFPQLLGKHPGKIHRIKDDGSIPADNPFVGQSGAVASVWSYGHRNPQALAFHPLSGELWETEHGPKGGDELNRIVKGKNYGWPVVSYGTHYDGRAFTERTAANDITGPVDYWVPSIAPCGMAFVSSQRYPAWRGQLLCGSLRFKYVDLCVLNDNQLVKHETLFPNIGRVRCITTDRNGWMYIAVEEPGMIFKLIPE